jgi:hypothetical protein
MISFLGPLELESQLQAVVEELQRAGVTGPKWKMRLMDLVRDDTEWPKLLNPAIRGGIKRLLKEPTLPSPGADLPAVSGLLVHIHRHVSHSVLCST